MAREQAARDAEPKDLAWAYAMEQKLRQFTMPRFQADEIDLTAIDCKTSFQDLILRDPGRRPGRGERGVQQGDRRHPREALE